MYVLNQANKKLEKIESSQFKTHNFRERGDLQEWIDRTPEVLGEPLLIIQKEFRGFDKTNERLDLLALDKQGNLVIIENKLDDSGKDVTWQALKYVSYCSALTTSDILQIYQDYCKIPKEKAEQNILAFLEKDDTEEFLLNEGGNQRIFLVAGEFRVEVSSTVLWLRKKGIDIRCIKASLYAHNNDIIVDFDQIIPVPEAEDFMMKLEAKEADENKHKELNPARVIAVRYWTELLAYLREKQFGLFGNVHSIPEGLLLGTGAGIASVQYQFWITKESCQVRLCINKKDSTGKVLFDRLKSHQTEIEAIFQQPLEWDEEEGRQALYIAYSTDEFGYGNEENWAEMQKWQYEHMQRLENALKGHLKG